VKNIPWTGVKPGLNKGGHAVSNDSIQFNYREGLKNLNYFCDRFDGVTLVDASGAFGELGTGYLRIKTSNDLSKTLSSRNGPWDTINDIISRLEISGIQNLRPTDDDETQQKPQTRPINTTVLKQDRYPKKLPFLRASMSFWSDKIAAAISVTVQKESCPCRELRETENSQRIF